MQQVDNKEVLSANNSTHEFNYIFFMIFFDTQGIERVQFNSLKFYDERLYEEQLYIRRKENQETNLAQPKRSFTLLEFGIDVFLYKSAVGPRVGRFNNKILTIFFFFFTLIV